jgi:hypothetical protein
MTTRECVPLCGATKVYGSRVQWWHHSPLCPARSTLPHPADLLGARNDGVDMTGPLVDYEVLEIRESATGETP